MAILHEFLTPATVAEASHLLAHRGRSAALLAGGAGLIAELERGLRPEIDTLIALNRLGLGYVRASAGHMHVGAMATFTDVLESEAASSLADGLLGRAARAEGPVNLRNAATVGGTVALAEPDSEFYAALLALGATVVVTDSEQPVPLETLAPGRRIILEVRVALRPARGGHARVARTPADRPIVAALAVNDGGGMRVALCGVAERPILEGTPHAPYADFMGSADYREAMAKVVAARARMGASDH